MRDSPVLYSLPCLDTASIQSGCTSVSSPSRPPPSRSSEHAKDFNELTESLEASYRRLHKSRLKRSGDDFDLDRINLRYADWSKWFKKHGNRPKSKISDREFSELNKWFSTLEVTNVKEGVVVDTIVNSLYSSGVFQGRGNAKQFLTDIGINSVAIKFNDFARALIGHDNLYQIHLLRNFLRVWGDTVGRSLPGPQIAANPTSLASPKISIPSLGPHSSAPSRCQSSSSGRSVPAPQIITSVPALGPHSSAPSRCQSSSSDRGVPGPLIMTSVPALEPHSSPPSWCQSSSSGPGVPGPQIITNPTLPASPKASISTVGSQSNSPSRCQSSSSAIRPQKCPPIGGNASPSSKGTGKQKPRRNSNSSINSVPICRKPTVHATHSCMSSTVKRCGESVMTTKMAKLKVLQDLDLAS